MSSKLSDVEKQLARSATLINAQLVDHTLAFNVPGGELYWAVRHNGHTDLSPEAVIALARGINLVYGATRGRHTIPWADTTPEDWLLVGGADSHEDNVELARITEAVAAWLGYPDRFKYAEACHANPAEVARRIKEAP